MKYTNTLLAAFAAIVGTASAATVTWTGATDTNFGTATNWDTGNVPVAADDVIIGDGFTVNTAGGPVNVASLTIGTGSAFSFGANGDLRNTITTNSTFSQVGGNAVGLQPGVTLNLGASGLFNFVNPAAGDIDFYTNGQGLTLNVVLDLQSASSGTLVTRDLVLWDGFTSGEGSISGTGVADTFTELNGQTFVQIADDTTPTNPGEISFFRDLSDGGDTVKGMRVQYVAVPEPSSTMLLGLSGLVLLARRRR